MDIKVYKTLVQQINIGKKLPDAIYLHISALEALPKVLVDFIYKIEHVIELKDDSWHLLKLFKNEFKVSFLSYPTFEEDSYPALQKSITIDLSKLSARETNYQNHDNPPILHRKETMVLPNHLMYEHFCNLTKEGEDAGLYENSRKIGFLQSWLRVINEKGYTLDSNGRIKKIDIQHSPPKEVELEIDRHKTALVRQGLSTPMKTLAKHEYLNGQYSIFDYGCGLGDDLRELEAHGLDALGWDPNYLPDADRVSSDIVNLGFVINVIEDRIERTEAILEAWHLTGKLLVVSAMLGSEAVINQFKPYKDGVLTARNTFQKYYTQGELRDYLEMTLDEPAIAVSPGVFYIFKDKLEEQRFLQNRYKRNYQWQQKTLPETNSSSDERIIFARHSALLEEFWGTVLNLGRCPAIDEFTKSAELLNVLGSIKKAFNLTRKHYGDEDLINASDMRKDDIILYLALSKFNKRPAYSNQSDSFKRDIKAFFSDC